MLPYRQVLLEQHAFPAQDDNKTRQGCRAASLKDAIVRSQTFLMSIQSPEGYWWAELESNIGTTAQTLLLLKVWGLDQRLPLRKLESYLRAQQRHHGGWGLFYEDGGDLSTAIEAYMALRLLKVPTTDPALTKARQFILERGGISKARVFTKLHLAIIGCFDWRGIPSLPPWLILLPKWFPTTIYDFSYWARVCAVPLLIVFDRKPVFAIDLVISLDELFVERSKTGRYDLPRHHDWTDCFIALDSVFKLSEKLNLIPFRDRALKAVERWMLERLDVPGGCGGLVCSTTYSLLAMRVRGFSRSDPTVEAALKCLTPYAIETDAEYCVQCTISPTWDTALAMRALAHSGLSRDHPCLRRGGEWLLEKQVLHHHGDWLEKGNKSTGRPGGWPFQFDNRWYPDLDDTATAVMALNEVELSNEPLKQAAITRAVEWIAAMQSKEGGWGAYDINNNQSWLNAVPFGDMKSMIDPSTADVTSRVLEMEGRLRKTAKHSTLLPKQTIDRALAYLRKEQEPEGCWYGRWGVNYIYGTCWALEAMALIAPKEHEQEILRGARWLVDCQGKDGGWGETCDSYIDASLKGQGKLSTISQIAWALMGLLAAGDAVGKYEMEAMEQGVHYLLQTQRQDGTWHEHAFTGTGFPGHFYLKYHLYALYFPLIALSRYQTFLKESNSPPFETLGHRTF